MIPKKEKIPEHELIDILMELKDDLEKFQDHKYEDLDSKIDDNFSEFIHIYWPRLWNK